MNRAVAQLEELLPYVLEDESAPVTFECRLLSALDLFTGIANVPLRVVAEGWVEYAGCPDALWVTLSSGARYELQPVLGSGGHCDVVPLNAAAERDAHLPCELYRQLCDAVYERLAEEMF